MSGGQTGFQGHVVNFPRDVQAFASQLPIAAEYLDVVLVRREGTDGFGQQTHRDFTVRPRVLIRWLDYLREHNPHYRGITINEPELRRLEVASASRRVPGGGCR